MCVLGTVSLKPAPSQSRHSLGMRRFGDGILEPGLLIRIPSTPFSVLAYSIRFHSFAKMFFFRLQQIVHYLGQPLPAPRLALVDPTVFLSHRGLPDEILESRFVARSS